MTCGSLFCACATLGPIGYLPLPGTMGTFVTLPIVWYIKTSVGIRSYILVVFLLAVFSFFIIRRALALLRNGQDPSEIVLDESVGIFVTYLAVPITIERLMLGFILFRFFDISKIGGIYIIEKMSGAWGILGDDIAAGAVSAAILYLTWYGAGI